MFYKYVEPREYFAEPGEDEEKKVGMDSGEYALEDKEEMSPLEAKEQEAKGNSNENGTAADEEERTRRQSRVSSRASRRNNRVSPEQTS